VRGNVQLDVRPPVGAGLPLFGDDIKKLFPIIQPGGSDSASFDNALELLVMSGRSLAHAMAILIPKPGRKRVHESAEAGLLRVPRIVDGAVGRSRRHRLY